MNLLCCQPNGYAVLIGSVLCLWSSLSLAFSVIKDRCLTTAILSPTVLTSKERYFYYIDLTNDCFYRKHNRKAAVAYANLALTNRVLIDTVTLEESFVSTLIDLGKYEQAKCLIEKLAPLRQGSPEYCLAPIVAYRQILLGRCYMGLHQYHSAALIFGKDVPDLIPENTTRQSLEWGAFVASICDGDNNAAKKVLEHWRGNDRHYYDLKPFSDEADNPVFRFFKLSIDLSPGDETAAEKLCDDYVKFWRKNDNIGDADAVPMLEAAATVMQNHGFLSQSAKLTVCANE
jgi:tetratricopeptide (TPR) repeat protein